MTLDQLRGLCAIVEQGSFKGAAETLHRSQPAISQQLKALERELGGRSLIDRKSNRATSLGHLVYTRARKILLDSQALQSELQDLDEHLEKELRLGCSDTTAMYLLPEYIRLLNERMPRTHITLINRSSDGIAELAMKGAVDLGIVTLPKVREELEERPLFRQRLVVVLPGAHRLARKRDLRLEHLREESMLQLDPDTRTGGLLREYFQRERFAPRVVLDSGSFEVIKRYVAEGLGISILPESVVREEDAHVVAQSLAGLPEVGIGAVWRRGGYLSRSAALLLELLQARAGELLTAETRITRRGKKRQE